MKRSYFTQPKNLLSWIAVNGTVAGLLAYGLAGESATQVYALNISLFFALVVGPLAVMGLMAAAVLPEDKLRQMQSKLPPWWSEVVYDTVWIVALAATGHFWAGASVLLQFIAHYVTYAVVRLRLEAEEAKAKAA